ncbi:hypothetical protein [Verrucomicrobium sp. BvORR034]|uniref:hypothetical protein n=1 Tax=Verrucomicrobium sp. BvORR034 TaxID=1396418 RepID=UPI0006798FBF|nr:hypothetical protein [Verrucomicrobium sp. BvORR034]
MKLPFIRRARHLEAVAEWADRVAKAKLRQAELAEKLKAVTEARGRELEHTRALSKLCEELKVEVAELRQREVEANPLRLTLLDRVAAARAGQFQKPQAPIPVVLCVDVEPDARVVDLADPSWRGTDVFLEKWPALRHILVKKSGAASVPLTWFPRADPQIERCNGSASFALQRYSQHWETAQAAGDEIGLHMHGWRWQEENNQWSQDHGDSVWMEHCLRSAIAEYRAHFGKAPPVYRGGDHYLDEMVLRVLREEGIALDMTLELLPTMQRLVEEESGTGCLPDCSMAPAHAYRPSVSDFTVPDLVQKEGLGILPLTPYQGGSLCLWAPNQVVDEALESIVQQHPVPTHLAFAVRSNIADTGYWESFVENTFSLARRAKEGSLRFVTASQAWQLAMSQMRGNS